MKMFKEIRRKDRILEENLIEPLLEGGEYGFLSMNVINGFGYGVPISFVKQGNSIYFHCAPEGYKLACIKEDPNVSFCVVGKTKVQPEKFTTAYESVIVFGTIDMDLSEEERFSALRLLVKKYSPDYVEIGEKYIKGSFDRTTVFRLDIKHITGKSRQM